MRLVKQDQSYKTVGVDSPVTASDKHSPWT